MVNTTPIITPIAAITTEIEGISNTLSPRPELRSWSFKQSGTRVSSESCFESPQTNRVKVGSMVESQSFVHVRVVLKSRTKWGIGCFSKIVVL